MKKKGSRRYNDIIIKKKLLLLWSFFAKHCLYVLFLLFALCFILSLIYGINHSNDPYSPIIGLLFSFLFIAIGAVIFFRNFKIKHKHARIIEIIGYVLLFVCIAWQLSIRDDLVSMSDNVYMEMKMDTMFEYMRATDEESKWRLITEYYRTVPSAESRSRLEAQIELSKKIAAVLQLISTICIAIGRFDDISPKIKNVDENSLSKSG